MRKRIKTNRLLIRPTEPADAPALAEIWTDPVVTRYMGGPRDYETLLREFAAEARQGQPDPFDLWPVIELASNEVVGHCGLLEKVAELISFDLIPLVPYPGFARLFAEDVAVKTK